VLLEPARVSCSRHSASSRSCSGLLAGTHRETPRRPPRWRLVFPNSNIETKLGETSSSLAASQPVRPLLHHLAQPLAQSPAAHRRLTMRQYRHLPAQIINALITEYPPGRGIHQWRMSCIISGEPVFSSSARQRTSPDRRGSIR
jgi:hypothetical protein